MKVNKEIIDLLSSDSEELILKGVEILRSTGNCKHIPDLIKLLRESNNSLIRKSIKELIFDIKDTDSIPYIVEEICNKDNKEELNTLVSACWQTGLNFSDHMKIFAQCFVTENFEVSIEAFTVIETHILDQKLSKENIDGLIKIFKSSSSKIAIEKRSLYEELLYTLTNS